MWNCSQMNTTNLINGKSTLSNAMAWCCQARSQYLSQCWPISTSPYGITRSHWVKSLRPRDAYMPRKTCHYCADDGRHQAIIWTNAEILLIGPLGTNFSGMLIKIHAFLFKKMHLKMSSVKCRIFCLTLNVLRRQVMKYRSLWSHGIRFLTPHY